MTASIATLGWPADRLPEALQRLAAAAGLPVPSPPTEAVPPPPEAEELPRWMAWAAGRLGLEAVAVEAGHGELEAALRRAAPALLPLRHGGLTVHLLLWRARGRWVWLLDPQGGARRLARAELVAALSRRAEAPHEAALAPLLATLPAARRPRARAALLRMRLAGQPLALGWLLRSPATAAAGLPWRPLAALLALLAAGYAAEVGAWRLIGSAALGGRHDGGWFLAWWLLMLSVVPLQWFGGWIEARFAIGAAARLKQRLLARTMHGPLHEERRPGLGQALALAFEAQALEVLALDGGVGLLVALLEAGFAAAILAAGAGGAPSAALLGAALALLAAGGWRYRRRLADWTEARLALTRALVERMVGHRTRLAQAPAGDDRDDPALPAYAARGTAMDAAALPLVALLPRAWLIAGLAALLPALMGGAGTGALAVGLGGVLFGHRALTHAAAAATALARAAVAWAQLKPVLAPPPMTPPAPFVADAPAAAGTPQVDAGALAFRHRPQARPVLDGLDLQVARGERLLLEGASGAGKSTLAALLCGLHRPEWGLLLLDGLDAPTLGPDWHRRATQAPQFHANHVFGGTLAFNLLMGRRWPPTEADLAEAQSLCEALGLGPLLERMPSGLQQTVGETGWQLSHGERSRVFLARALLQRAPLTLLDESFAALDPPTLARCVAVAREHAATLLVIAHP